MITNYNPQQSLSCASPIPDANNFFSNTYRPPSPYYLPSQEMNNNNYYYSQYTTTSMDRMTPSPLSIQPNPIKSSKNIITDISIVFNEFYSFRYWYKW
jgi:hypothetical protein